MHARNVVVLIGRLTADPVLRFTNGGSAVAEFGVAVNRPTRNPDGSFGNDALDGFFDCEIWGKLGEVVAEQFKKGNEIYVAGSLIQSRWESKEGRKLTRVVVKVKTIGPALSPPRKTEAVQEQPAAEQQQVPQPA